jgi:HAD superfamily hydrolase (TIGR01509 family)
VRRRVVLLDMDGTLFRSDLDWAEIRARIGVPRNGRAILEQLESAAPETRERGLRVLAEAERRAAETGLLIDGASELLAFLHRKGVRTALVTNNSRRSVDTLLARHPLSFDLVVSRDEGVAKPDPRAFLRAIETLGSTPREAVAIGDAHIDVVAAHRAGIARIILVAAEERVVELIPRGIRYLQAADLREVREVLEELLP